MVKESTSNAVGVGSTLIGDLRTYLLCGVAKKKKSLILSLSQRISGLKCKVLKSYHSSLTYSKWEQISRNWSIFYQLKSPDYEYFSIFLSKNKKRLLAYRFGVLLLCFQKKTSKTKAADPRGPGFKARNHSSSPGRV